MEECNGEILQEFHSWKPNEPIIVDSDIHGITIDWKQLKFKNNDMEKYFIYKLQCKSKINGWTQFYSGGKTRKYFENLQPSRQHIFRLKVILKGSYLKQILSKTETDILMLNCEKMKAENFDGQTEIPNNLKVCGNSRKSVEEDTSDLWRTQSVLAATNYDRIHEESDSIFSCLKEHKGPANLDEIPKESDRNVRYWNENIKGPTTCVISNRFSKPIGEPFNGDKIDEGHSGNLSYSTEVITKEPMNGDSIHTKSNSNISYPINRNVPTKYNCKWLESLWSEEFRIFTKSEGPTVLCFCMAVRCGYIKQVQVMLEQRRDLLSICNSTDGFTPLAIAVRKGNLAMVKFLINQGADVNQVSTTKQTPIQLSAYHRHLEVSTLLLEQGADIRITDRNGLNLLHYAVDSNDLNIVKFALKSGCDVTGVDNNGWTPLLRAVIQGADGAIVQILVENGSSIQHTDERNLDLMTYARMLKNRDDIRRIVDQNFVHEKAVLNFTNLSKKISNVHSLLSK